MTTHDRSSELLERVKNFHRCFPTGVTLVTVSVDDVPYGLVVNAFSSVSLDPAMAMVCVKATSQTYPHLYASDQIAIAVLATDQADIASRFAQSTTNKFAGLQWVPGHNGAPVVDGVSAVMELTVVSRIPAGTHTIFVGEITNASASDRPPLIYQGSRFYDGGRLEPATNTHG